MLTVCSLLSFPPLVYSQFRMMQGYGWLWWYLPFVVLGTICLPRQGHHLRAGLTQFARAVRALNDPVALSFGHEMNGFWYPWGTTHTTPAEFVAAWRRIHNLFAQAGASNVIWVWNPNDIFPVPQVQLQPYYPGNAYVDWIGITRYFSTTGPHTYAQLYAPTLAEVRTFSDKPFIIVGNVHRDGAQ